MKIENKEVIISIKIHQITIIRILIFIKLPY